MSRARLRERSQKGLQQSEGFDGSVGRVAPADNPQLVVVERLQPETDAVHAEGFPCFGLFGGNVVGIGLDGELAQTRRVEVESFRHPGYHPRDFVGREQRRGSSTYI